jgi:hypothetical protein
VNTYKQWLNIYAAKGFPIAPKRLGMDKFVGIGTILYYYEVTQMSSRSADWLVLVLVSTIEYSSF